MAIRDAIEAVGLSPLPDFRIRDAFAKLKALLRKAADRTVDDLWDATADLIDLFTPQECRQPNQITFVRRDGHLADYPLLPKLSGRHNGRESIHKTVTAR